MKLRQFLFILAFILTSQFAVNAQADSSNCAKYRSLYGQYLKQEMYRDAMNFWSMAYTYCGGMEGTDLKFFKNARIGYLKLWEAEQDATIKAGLRDTVYWIYETLITKDPQPADWKGKYAVMLMTEGDTRLDKIEGLFREAIGTLKEATPPVFIKQYFKFLILNRFNAAPADKQNEIRNAIIEEYLVLSDYCSKAASGLRANQKEEEAKKYDDAQEFMDKYFLQIVNDCAILTSVVEKKIGSLPQTKEAKIEKVNSYINLMDKKKCQSTEIYAKLLDTLITTEPTAEAYYKTGKYYQELGNDAKAVDYFQKAVDLEGAGANKDKYTYLLADSQYKAKKYSAAFRTAKLVEGEFKGKAMVICGNAVAASAGGCGETTFARKSNYWLANDYYRKAAALGEDVSTSKFLGDAPTQEECFNEGVSMGSSVYLSCWGESTTAR